MHELSIMEHILNITLDYGNKNGAKSISRINLTIGELSDIIPRWAQIYFGFAAKGTIAEKAELHVETVSAIIKCLSCETEIKLDKGNLKFFCDICGSKYIQLISGREFRIKSIEIEC